MSLPKENEMQFQLTTKIFTITLDGEATGWTYQMLGELHRSHGYLQWKKECNVCENWLSKIFFASFANWFWWDKNFNTLRLGTFAMWVNIHPISGFHNACFWCSAMTIAEMSTGAGIVNTQVEAPVIAINVTLWGTYLLNSMIITTVNKGFQTCLFIGRI